MAPSNSPNHYFTCVSKPIQFVCSDDSHLLLLCLNCHTKSDAFINILQNQWWKKPETHQQDDENPSFLHQHLNALSRWAAEWLCALAPGTTALAYGPPF